MISAQEFYKKVQETHAQLYQEQMNACESEVADMFARWSYDTLKVGKINVWLKQYPLPEVIETLENLGYCNVMCTVIESTPFSKEPACKLSFSVPQLVDEEISTSSKNTL